MLPERCCVCIEKSGTVTKVALVTKIRKHDLFFWNSTSIELLLGRYRIKYGLLS